MSELERNVEALVRAAAARQREAEAKARFLGALAPRTPWPAAAAAAVVLVATLGAVFRRLETPPAAPVVDAAKPSVQEPAWIPLRPLGEDTALALKARLPARAARAPLLLLEGTADLADRHRIFVSVYSEAESYDGRRLRPESTLRTGAFTQVTRGRIAMDTTWTTPAPLLVRASLKDSDQIPEILAAMKGKSRDWSFQAAGWDDALIARLEPALDEVEVAAAELGALLKEVEAACVSEERWKAESPRLKPKALALLARAEKPSLLAAAAQLLFYTARNLASDSTYFKWEGKEFQGPVSYHADKQKLKTFREEAWTFAALRRYAAEAPEVAARELALWIVKDRRRAGPRPEHAAPAKRTPFADRFGPDADLDALEAEIRR